jgi:hypothetical protein
VEAQRPGPVNRGAMPPARARGSEHEFMIPLRRRAGASDPAAPAALRPVGIARFQRGRHGLVFPHHPDRAGDHQGGIYGVVEAACMAVK